ncbi:beta-lactamase domain protein [Solidesulfovibrio carbinoliphilus subsp. oakridgensis]|uniref:Beta-lactamase domain protein n=1 Tax=Solidesulfovibrio carbinoliphilus subsp. oakridgensis TaxID=694327 RepID=G7Q4J9_9BACT|nr:MBL fold metallo-hydrolase [Solidesulfovibrio carbinoliphilus]EHJ47222.1 beta-lactamase domain protein [Solidesulfovibrio carbinoliphilus subsp. oakridgensis]
MPARIVYIQHDCFFLLVGGRTLLFDYPAPNYLPEAAAKVAASRIAGADLTVFASHSHDDHFDPDMAAATATAASRRFVVADDVADLYGDRLPPETVVLEPDDVRQVGDLRVEGLESNDMGLAYRIEADGLSVYFGGDLALWDWPGQSPAAARAVGMSWRRALRRIAGRPVDVAFSNMDPRLPSLSGAPQFVEAVAPRVFVPMHLGGHTRYVDQFAGRLARPGTTLFRYARPGDVFTLSG